MEVKDKRFLIVIPAYNEEETIEEIVRGAMRYADVCVIDDGSQDRTGEILSQFQGIHVIRHEKNTHITKALIDGMRYAVDQGYDYIITMDAGMSHDYEEILNFIDHPHSDLAIGTRISRINVPLYRHFLSFMGNLAFNLSLDFPRSLFKRRYLRDTTSGYRRYSNKAMRLVLSRKLESHTAEILYETTMLIYKNGLTISEVPITYKFTNSYFNPGIVKDCAIICLKCIIRPRS